MVEFCTPNLIISIFRLANLAIHWSTRACKVGTHAYTMVGQPSKKMLHTPKPSTSASSHTSKIIHRQSPFL